MFIDVADLGTSPKHIDARVPADEIELGTENVRLLDEVEFVADAIRNEPEIDVKGRISFKAEVDCTRCLNPVEYNRTIEFDIKYVTPEQFALEKEHEIEGADLETDVIEGDRIDVRDIVREQLLLDLPEQIFCSEDCKGICPKCGADRNLIDCKCEEEEIDPRWSALKNLK